MTKCDYPVKRVLDVKAQLGEGPAWSVDQQALFWIDIHGFTINRFDPASGDNRVWILSVMPGSFALREGNGAIIAAADGIYDFDFGTGAMQRLMPAPYDTATHRFNDGKPDRQGRFWVGSMPLLTGTELSAEKTGSYYRFDGVSLERGFSSVSIANGTAFSPDGRTMYRAESFERVIYSLDYDPETGSPSRQRVFAEVPAELGYPDGATVDTEGGYWTAATVGATSGNILRFTPDGKLDFYFEMPVLLPSMVVFGGQDMSTLYITSISDFDARYPGDMAGDIFAVETSFKGIGETKFPAL